MSTSDALPGGAVCAHHPDAPARFVCRRCGDFACVACAGQAASRCIRCWAARDAINPDRVSIIETLKATYRMLSTSLGPLAPRLAALLAAAVLLVAFRGELKEVPFASHVLQTVPLAVFAFSWHRVVLTKLGHDVRGRFASWRGALFVALFFLAIPLSDLLGQIPWETDYWTRLSAWFLVTYGGARLSLILPALASGQPLSLNRIWAAGRRNGWRMAWAIILVALPIDIAAALTSRAAEAAGLCAERCGGIGVLARPIAVSAQFTTLSLIYHQRLRPQGATRASADAVHD